MNPKEIASRIDHTLLKPDATHDEIVQLCEEAATNKFAAVCVPPYFVKAAAQLLEDKMTKVATVVGFPMGYSATPAKVEEVKRAMDEGADEIDVVVNICAVREGNWSFVRNDIDSMTRAAHLRGKAIKVILEVGLLKEGELKKLCDICNAVDVNFVKTSTGVNGSPATPEMIKTLRSLLNDTVKIKASAGIRTFEHAKALVEAGAHRLGTSAGLDIIDI